MFATLTADDYPKNDERLVFCIYLRFPGVFMDAMLAIPPTIRFPTNPNCNTLIQGRHRIHFFLDLTEFIDDAPYG
jgi:hypothetical protein